MEDVSNLGKRNDTGLGSIPVQGLIVPELFEGFCCRLLEGGTCMTLVFRLGGSWSAKARSSYFRLKIDRRNVFSFIIGSYLERNEVKVTTPTSLTFPQLGHRYSSA